MPEAEFDPIFRTGAGAIFGNALFDRGTIIPVKPLRESIDVAGELTRQIADEFEPARRVVDIVGLEVPIPNAVICALDDQAQQAAARRILAIPWSCSAVGQVFHGKIIRLRSRNSETARLAHVPEKCKPVFQKDMRPRDKYKAQPDLTTPGCALDLL